MYMHEYEKFLFFKILLEQITAIKTNTLRKGIKKSFFRRHLNHSQYNDNLTVRDKTHVLQYHGNALQIFVKF